MIQPIDFTDLDPSAYAAQPTGRPSSQARCIDCGADIPTRDGRFVRHPARVMRGGVVVTVNRDCPGAGCAP